MVVFFCRSSVSRLTFPFQIHGTAGVITRRCFNSKIDKAKKASVLKRNRNDPKLEEASRKRRLTVPLDEVSKDWQLQFGPKHLEAVGRHFNLFEDLYGEPFLPLGFMNISYGGGVTVSRGNIIRPSKAQAPPTVTLPARGECSMRGEEWHNYWTLVMTNPDGHLVDNEMEVLHWMVGNIECGKLVSSGEEVCTYLPPLPVQGTGVHRIVFSLYSHCERLNYTLPSQDGSWLDQRGFSSRRFLSSHSPLLSPFTFSLFQTLWDESVTKIFSETLNVSEPIYEVEKLPSRRKVKETLIKETRSQRYRDLVALSQ